MPVDERWIGLDEFDSVEVEILPGQEWLHAGELVFKHVGNEVFRLSGVPRPVIFQHVCQTARTALLSVREVVERQAAAAG